MAVECALNWVASQLTKVKLPLYSFGMLYEMHTQMPYLIACCIECNMETHSLLEGCC